MCLGMLVVDGALCGFMFFIEPVICHFVTYSVVWYDLSVYKSQGAFESFAVLPLNIYLK